ncbi:nuclear transport factor 2 family protein [Pseudonocardia sp. CA-107938]|uniref:nuclear transport factor 2 family protein n=1 Tax=Pseudonocardia sp. CA-107938 TaxID=3240021 RepID=UPI003D8B37F9
MATASENHQLLSDYYAAYGSGGPEGLARMAAFYAENKPSYTAGNSELSGETNSPEESLKVMRRLQELSGGNITFAAPPTVLVAGDAVVALLVHEKHARIGRPELVVPRLYVYEIADGKISKSFGWQLEAKAFDEYYPRG